MKLTHETGAATLIQFIVLGLLNILGTINSTVSACREDSFGCLTEIFVSSILYLMLMAWFGLVCLIGFAAQERRSRRMAQVLIGAEGLIALVSVFSIKYPTNMLGRLTSLVAFGLAIWIITLAYRLMRAGDQRITKHRPRRRRQRH